MGSGDDWLMRPVLRGMCQYLDLKTGAISLYDVAVMNDALDVEGENNRRYEEAASARTK